MAESLQEYNSKRNFKKTAEPKGQKQKSPQKLSFVVQHHLASRDHYDFRLEWNGTLLSWAVPKGPSFSTKDKRLAVQVEDHPVDYRNFEGNIPKGQYGGGVVMLWDEGDWVPQKDVSKGLRDGMLKFTLNGTRLKGKWALIRMNSKAGDGKFNWLLIKEKDEFAKTKAGISAFKTSVRTGRTMTQIEKEQTESMPQNPFQKADIQLAKLTDEIPVKGEWLYEVKYDGYRILSYTEKGETRLMSRGGHDYTDKFPKTAKSLTEWISTGAAVLDGEMVVLDAKGKSDFQALQQYIKHRAEKRLHYVVFDLLAYGGEDLRQSPLKERKRLLKTLMKNAPEGLVYSEHSKGKGEECFQAAAKANLEGIIGKKADSVYSGTRNGDWIKLKCDTRQEFVIGGYTVSEINIRSLSSVLLGVYEDGRLIYSGRAGTGFTDKSARELKARLDPLKRQTSPFRTPADVRPDERIIWVKPQLAAEIKFAEWTKEGRLRQASFKGIREDKNLKEIKKETPKASAGASGAREKIKSGEIYVENIKITSPEKIVYPQAGISKLEVVEYYKKISKRMLPYTKGRILSTVRCPKGVSGEKFFKKHADENPKGIIKQQVPNSEGKNNEYFYIEKIEGLIYEAQMNTLEFHIWGSKVKKLEYPDIMVFDLDPDEGMEIEQVRTGVRDIKKLLDNMGLISFLKTSGGKGYHVVVPFEPSASWEKFRDFAKGVAVLMEEKYPDRYTSNVRKEKRKGKIFIDWIRNGRSATSVAPYSLRAREGGAVSMPIAWRELSKVLPDGIKMEDALRRMKNKDPWEEFFQIKQKLV